MNVHFSSETDLWATPQKVFDKLNERFHFSLDPCSTKENAKCAVFYTKEENGLLQDWGGHRVFMNPPYGREIKHWVKKAAESNALCVALLPARVDTQWYHDHIQNKAFVYFLKGRLKFGDATNSAPFPSMIVIFNAITL